jgi:FlaA1/EpsC-like NDP-sugar epimerase
MRSFPMVSAYWIGLALSFCLAFAIRFDFALSLRAWYAIPLILVWVLPLKLGLLYAFRQVQIVPGFFGISDLARLFYATGIASLLLGLARGLTDQFTPPGGVIPIDFLLSLVVLVGIRMGLRLWQERLHAGPRQREKSTRRVGIIGAGEAGAILAAELRSKRGLGLEPVAFFDDDPLKWRATMYNIPVLGPPEVLLKGVREKLRLDEAIISMPSAPAQRIREIIAVLQQAKVRFRTVPSLTELALGRIQVSQLRSVEVEDLLGRPPIQLETENIRALLAGQTVMVTGAGGSIGSELCRQIAGFGPARLLLVERSEVQMFPIEQELIRKGHRALVCPFVVDILDQPRLRQIFETRRPKVIFHAAAHKHVPMMESQPGEAIRNNTLGTALLAELAVEFGVDRFVLISTDKAINPTSVMGATKRLAEMFLQSLHAANSTPTRLMAVRFGNVLGSSGSVIPIFKDQIANGGPVTVTHPDMTRYFMTIPEAVGLVLQSAAQGAGGEVFLLDMGKPVKILDLARHLIELSGLEPDKDIKIEFVGLRPGEKLFEELNYEQESLGPTTHSKIRRYAAQPAPLPAMQKTLHHLSEVLYKAGADEFKLLLKQAVPEYTPFLAQPQPVSAEAPSPAAEAGAKGEG